MQFPRALLGLALSSSLLVVPPALGAEPPAEVTLEAAQPGLTYYLRSESATFSLGGRTGTVDVFQHVCEAPCTVRLPRGTYRFGLAVGGDRPTETTDAIRIEGDTTVRGALTSRKTERVALLAGGGALVATGFVLTMVAGQQSASAGSDGLFAGGIVTASLGVVAMVVSSFVHDRSEAESAPRVGPRAPDWQRGPEPKSPPLVARGQVTWSLAF